MAVVDCGEEAGDRQVRREPRRDLRLPAVDEAHATAFWAGETAFTNTRRPSASRQRAARPGEKPPAWLRASTTGEPTSTSIAARTSGATSDHSMR